MDISIFFARVLGLYFLITSIGMLVNSSRYKMMIQDGIHSPSLWLLSGALTLIIGILLVVTHNIWIEDWPVLITIIAWISLIKGIIRVVFPQWSFILIEKFSANVIAYWTTSIIVLLLGLVLVYFGFQY